MRSFLITCLVSLLTLTSSVAQFSQDAAGRPTFRARPNWPTVTSPPKTVTLASLDDLALKSDTAATNANTRAIAGLASNQNSTALGFGEEKLDYLTNSLVLQRYGNEVTTLLKIGDSVAGQILDWIVATLLQSYEQGVYFSRSSAAGVINYANVTTTGLLPYAAPKKAGTSQSKYNGIATPLALTRSGTVASATYSNQTDPVVAAVGQALTVKGATELEWNGTYAITGISTNTAVTPNITTVTYSLTATPASTAATGTITTYGTAADFTWSPAGDHYELKNTDTWAMDAGLAKGFTSAEVYLVAEPSSGTATVRVSDYASNSTISTQTVTLTSSTTGLTEVKFTLSPQQNYRVTVEALGKVIVYVGAFSRPKGIALLNWDMGGSTIAQNIYANATVQRQFAAYRKVKLITVNAKEESFWPNGNPTSLTAINAITTLPGVLPQLAAFLRSIPNCSKMIFASLPDGPNEIRQKQEAIYYRKMAQDEGWAFYDGFGHFGTSGNITRVLSMSLGGGDDKSDPIHNLSGRVVANSAFFNRLLPAGPLERRDVKAANVEGGQFYVTNNDATDQRVDLFSIGQGAESQYVYLRNTRRVFFGPSTSAMFIAQSGGDIITFNNNGSFGPMKASTVNVSGAVQANRFQGQSSTPTVSLFTPAGTGATATVSGNGAYHIISFTTGSNPTSGDIASVNISSAGYSSIPVIQVQQQAGLIRLAENGQGNGVYLLTAPSALEPNKLYTIYVQIGGK